MYKILTIIVLLLAVGGLTYNKQADIATINTGSTDIAVNKKNIQGGAVLDLSGQGLEKAPEYIFSRKDITKLDLSNNNLEGSLQAEIRYLQNLKELNLSNNKFTGVPAEIGQLKNLEVLDLSNNQLTGLPYELGNLHNLKMLNISGNNYSVNDLNKIKESLPQGVEIILK